MRRNTDCNHGSLRALLTGALFVCASTQAFAADPAPPGDASKAVDNSRMMDAREMMRWGTELFLLSEILEIVPTAESRPVRYDLLGWVGGATNRIWVKAEGKQSTRTVEGDAQLQVLYGKLISPFWDLQVGINSYFDYAKGSRARWRPTAALGVQGLAPGWFEVEPTLFVSLQGHVSARLTASYDLLLSQRLVAQSRVEAGAALQSVPEFGVGSGLTDVELGLRVRYEVMREVAPYIGVSWQRLFMQTERIAIAEGSPVSDVSLLVGLRLWY